MIEFELAFPPSVNHYYRRVGRRMLISREGRRYRDRVVAALAALGVRPLNGPLQLWVELYPPDRRRRDIDNSMKALLDSMEHAGTYPDDSQIAECHIRKFEPVPGGRVIVRIRSVGN